MTSLVTELNEDYRRVMKKQIGVIIAAEEWRDAIADKGGVCLENAVALESMFPGELSSKAALNTFTVSTSRTNYAVALESSDNIITRAVTAIINAFRDFFSRIVGWFKQIFAGKKRCDPTAGIECVSKPVGADIFAYMDKYPGVVTDYLTHIHEDLAPHAGLAGGKLLESFFHVAMMEHLRPVTTGNIVAIVEGNLPGISVTDLKQLVTNFGSYVEQLTDVVKKTTRGQAVWIAGHSGGLADALKEVRAKFIKLPMWVGTNNKNLELTTGPGLVLNGLKTGAVVVAKNGTTDPAEIAFANITKFYSFFDTGSAKSFKDISLTELEKEMNALITMMGKMGTQEAAAEIPGLQATLQDAFVMLNILNLAETTCVSYAKAHVNGLLGRHKAMLALLAMVEKSPIALPADVRGMAKTKSDIETTIKSLEKSL